MAQNNEEFIYKQALEDAKELLKVLPDIASNYTALAKASKELTTNVGKLNKQSIDQVKKEKELVKVQQEEEKLARERIRTKDLEKKQADKLAKAQERQRRELEKQNSLYQQHSKRLNDARKEAKELALQYGVNSRQFNDARKNVIKLDKQLKKIDGSLGQNQRSVGNYGKALGGTKKALLGVAGALGISAGISALTNAFRNGVKVFSGFTAEISKLQAISGATKDEINELQANAELLGSVTQKTAKDVASLQIEYAKLGFKPKEILAATEATLALSIATGEGLAESAGVAGATLKGFGLDAEETKRVTDVMAASFSSSALDLEKFRESMKLVAPIAKAANIDIETTTSLLGNLADSGLAGSIAGTGLKNILSKLSDENSSLSKELGFTVKNSDDLIKAFKLLKERNIDLTKATELTDERSKAAFLTMIDGVDSVEKLRKSLKNSAGAAQRMADIMADNLAGDTDKARSAMEGLAISAGKRLDSAMRTVVQGFTKFVGKIDEMIKLKPSEELMREQGALNNLVGAITSANNTQESRNRLIKELQKDYPDFLGNLDSEKVTNEELRDRLIEVNSEYRKKINILAKQELIQKNQQKLVELQLEELEAVKSLTNAQARLEQVRGTVIISGDQVIDQGREQQKVVNILTNRLEKNRREQEFLNNALQRDLDLLTELQGEEGNQTKEVEKNTKEINKNTAAIEKNKEKAKEREKDIDTIRRRTVEDSISREKLLEETRIKNLESVNEGEFKKLQERYEANKAYLLRVEDDEKESLERRKQAYDLFSQATSDLGNAFFDIAQNRRDRELQTIESNYNQRIESARNAGQDTETLEKELARKRAKINYEQAKADQNQALFNVGIQTAENIVKYTGGLPATAPLLTLAIATGLAQAAVIKSQPLPEIPAFFKGTDSAPSGNILFGEAGRELIIPKDGSPFIADKPTIASGLQGAKIYSNPETEAILQNVKLTGQRSDSRILKDIHKAITNQKHNVTIVNKTNNTRVNHFANKYNRHV